MLEPVAAERDFILEWQWSPYAGADGYGAYLAGGDLAGPYELQVRQAATAGTGSQKFSRTLADAAAGELLVTARTTGIPVGIRVNNACYEGFPRVEAVWF